MLEYSVFKPTVKAVFFSSPVLYSFSFKSIFRIICKFSIQSINVVITFLFWVAVFVEMLESTMEYIVSNLNNLFTGTISVPLQFLAFFFPVLHGKLVTWLTVRVPIFLFSEILPFAIIVLFQLDA